MKEKNSKSRASWRERLKAEYRANPRLFWLYVVLRAAVVAILIAQLQNRDFANAGLCLLTLVLFAIPSFIERRIKIDVPDTLETIVLIFIFSAEILGEIREYYINVPGWDTMLHTTTGFLAASVGIALIDILNRTKRFAFRMSPLFVALVAFCFSMTIGVVWEFSEFGMDVLFDKDMQKDTVVSTIHSVTINPDGKNIPVVVTGIDKTVIHGYINGEETETVINGYLDVGLYDTMKDLLVNFLGAAVFSIIGYFYIRSRGSGKNGRFARKFILTKITPPGETTPPDIPNEHLNTDVLKAPPTHIEYVSDGDSASDKPSDNS